MTEPSSHTQSTILASTDNSPLSHLPWRLPPRYQPENHPSLCRPHSSFTREPNDTSTVSVAIVLLMTSAAEAALWPTRDFCDAGARVDRG